MIMKNEKEVHELLETFLWEDCSDTTRNQLAEKLSEIFGYQFKDESQPTQIDNQFLSFHGYNPETKKMTIITVNQAT